MRACSSVAFLLALGGCGCVTHHYREIAEQAAARDLTSCESSIAVRLRALSDWAFVAETCAGKAYYRCWSRRKSGGRIQCCARVASEDEATSLVGAGYYADELCREAQ
jgi:hypothetical protein